MEELKLVLDKSESLLYKTELFKRNKSRHIHL